MDAVYPSLQGRGVVVTGGASGIGAELVERFAGQGAHVAFLDLAQAEAESLQLRIAEKGGPVPRFLPCDVTDIDALRRALAQAEADVGPVRVLVNNAANDERHDLAAVTPDYWNRCLAVNLNHQFFAAQALSAGMAAAGGGSIINLGSTSWMMAQGGMPGYTTAKAAILGLTRSLARDLGPGNIRVNCVVPGWTMTEKQIRHRLTEEAKQDLLNRLCIKRLLMPVEVARMVLFLAAEDSSGCTAQEFVVDLGQT